MALIGGMPFIELKTYHQDEVRAVLEDWPDTLLLIAYKYLQARGISSLALDAKIDAAIVREMKGETGG